MLLKPTRGLRSNKSHTLTRDLVCYWLMNEGTGILAGDSSGNKNKGTLSGNAFWSSGKFGAGIEFPGADGDYVNMGTSNRRNLNEAGYTFLFWAKLTALPSAGNWDKDYFMTDYVDASNSINIKVMQNASNSLWAIRPTIKYDGNEVSNGTAWTADPPCNNRWSCIAVTWDKQVQRLYIDGVEVDNDTAAYSFGSNIGIRYLAGYTKPIHGIMDCFCFYNRCLSALEIALLYREPFCVFENPIRPELIGSQIVNLVGTTAALSSLSATAKTMRKVIGNVTSISDVEALLNSIRDRLETERNWLKEALFNGMTANAFKLGTTLSLGWFWVRIGGCSALYRGSGMEEIDFVNVLAVAESEACEISGPSYIPHNIGSTYFYVARQFNNCGYQEHTLAAAVKVSIDSNGNLAVPQPNNIFSSKVEQVNGNKIQLVWFYCPLAQKSQPVCFNVYYDNRTGQINYQNPLATIGYKGRKFYSHQTSALEAGKYLFAIRPEDASDIENSSLAQLRIQFDTTDPEVVDILKAEAV